MSQFLRTVPDPKLVLAGALAATIVWVTFFNTKTRVVEGRHSIGAVEQHYQAPQPEFQIPWS